MDDECRLVSRSCILIRGTFDDPLYAMLYFSASLPANDKYVTPSLHYAQVSHPAPQSAILESLRKLFWSKGFHMPSRIRASWWIRKAFSIRKENDGLAVWTGAWHERFTFHMTSTPGLHSMTVIDGQVTLPHSVIGRLHTKVTPAITFGHFRHHWPLTRIVQISH